MKPLSLDIGSTVRSNPGCVNQDGRPHAALQIFGSSAYYHSGYSSLELQGFVG